MPHAFAHVAQWLIERSLSAFDLEDILDGCARRLVEAGLPLIRFNLAFRLIHPLIDGYSLVWSRDRDMTVYQGMRGRWPRAQWTLGPYQELLQTGRSHIRVIIERTAPSSGSAPDPYPIITDLRELGATDYIAFAARFSDREDDGMVGSFAIDRPEGLYEHEIESLLALRMTLALVLKVAVREYFAQSALVAYLGRDAAVRVLRGQIGRGDLEPVYAVVWYCDLRGSTQLADTLPTAEYMSLLNAYFECTAGAVLDAGGQVLLLLGDAVLAIFPAEPNHSHHSASAEENHAIQQTIHLASRPPPGLLPLAATNSTDLRPADPYACRAALAAIRTAHARASELNRARAKEEKPLIKFGIGIHLGDLQYGNIGVPERLQFTVVGPVANEVARIENLTKTMKREVLVSDTFAHHVPLPWEHMGKHQLRGVGEARDIFALPESALAPEPSSP